MEEEIENLKDKVRSITGDYGQGGNTQKRDLWDAIYRIEEVYNNN